jgi:tubulin--tyrosine ligase
MSKRPSSLLCSHVPDSHLVSIDHPDYVEEALCDLPELQQMHDSGQLYLLKASMVDRGKGLYLLRSVDDFEAAITAAGNEDVREWVLQQYVQRPLLVHGTKFHIRAYVLCAGNLSVFLFNRMLALFACRPYDLQSDCLLSHLTNTCLAAEQPGFSAADCIRTLESLPLPASPHPCSLRSLHGQIAAILSELFTCLHSEPTAFQPLPAAFELFGFDFLCDDTGNVWLLEANAGPDFGQSGDDAGRQIIEELMEQTARMIVDTAAATAAAGRSQEINLAQSAQEGVGSGYVQLDDGEWTDWDEAKHGHFRLCYSRLISHSVRMRYY